ncbi:MAG TPA: YraN family protein [Verrucomicrobiae bacterium]|nr:YraN family protein [Verrucomicrobiae bacterium]
MSSGAAAEDRALSFLQAQGLKLIARNWRCKLGELDLVLADADTVVIAEVRSRRRSDYGSAAETVDWRKQAKLVRATRVLLAARPELAERPLRFDLVTLDGDGAVEWLREAFDVSE